MKYIVFEQQIEIMPIFCFNYIYIYMYTKREIITIICPATILKVLVMTLERVQVGHSYFRLIVAFVLYN